jgi:hypothetical protein
VNKYLESFPLLYFFGCPKLTIKYNVCCVHVCYLFLTASLWDAYALCHLHPSYVVVAYPLFFKFILSFRACWCTLKRMPFICLLLLYLDIYKTIWSVLFYQSEFKYHQIYSNKNMTKYYSWTSQWSQHKEHVFNHVYTYILKKIMWSDVYA